VSNAIKYTPAGGHVTVRTAVAGGELIVFVEDDGIGIPPEHVPHIFERFYRVDPNSDIEGTGLGLTIVKTVVERHGGRVGVRSTGGQGSVFFFTLPLLSPD
jgi:signal transduction histidine kinase